jgi:hypothetical protein
MIHINLNDLELELPTGWADIAEELTEDLIKLDPSQRSDFIDKSRNKTWGDKELVEALIRVAGNKCWYSEVPLEGQDANVDHFRPKGRVVEVSPDPPFDKTGVSTDGYWWLAFQWKNFRLSSMHANQRRVDLETQGGKADFFPILGSKAADETDIDDIIEEVLPLDPCSPSDMELIWFDPDGKPGFKNWKRQPTAMEEKRLKISTWLYHLDKNKIVKARTEHVVDIRNDLKTADHHFKRWDLHGQVQNLTSKKLFDKELAKIKRKIALKAPYAGAKRCAVILAMAKYSWIRDYIFSL